jgi:hypothetical protein
MLDATLCFPFDSIKDWRVKDYLYWNVILLVFHQYRLVYSCWACWLMNVEETF